MLVQFLKDANFRLPSLFSILFEHLHEKKERERKEKEFIEETLQEVLSPREERKEDLLATDTNLLKVPDSGSFLKPPEGASGGPSLLMPPEGASGGESISLLKIETPNRRMQPRGKNVSVAEGKGHQGRQAKSSQGNRRQSQTNQKEPKGFLNRMMNAMQ